MKEQKASQLLRALGQRIGIADLQFNEDRVCRIVIDGSTVVDVEQLEDEQTFYLISTVGSRVPANADTYELLLRANLFGRGTGGAVLSYDEDKDEVILFQALNAQWFTEEGFASVFEKFLEYTENWIKELLELDDEEPEMPVADAGDQHSFIRV